MTENTPPDAPYARRPLWIILAALGFIVLIALCLTTAPGRSVLSSAASALGINLVIPTEESPTEVPTGESPTEPPTEEFLTQEVTAPPTDEPTETVEPTEEVTPEVTETQEILVGTGACYETCDPADSNCLPGLLCVPGGGGYICWNDLICSATSVPVCNFDGVCDPGEGSDCLDCNLPPLPPPPDPCAKEACGDGYCSWCPVDWNCPADCISVTPPSCVCGNAVCEPLCGEDDTTCGADCPSGCRCGDEICGPVPACGEDLITCPFDCCLAGCGDGVCDTVVCGEDSTWCSDCCAGATCGDGSCDYGCGEFPGGCVPDCGGV